MSALDAVLLAAILGLGFWRLVAPAAGRRVRPLAGAAVAGLAVVHHLAHGFTWQLVPGWLLLAAAAAPLTLHGPAARIAAGMGLAGLLAAAAVPWLILPVPQLPEPTGPYAIGTRIYRLTDPRRPEDATADPADRRALNVQAWYPAAPGATGPPLPYIDGLGRMPARISAFPGFVFGRFGEVDTHASGDAPISSARQAWPVVVFSPGYGAPRASGSGLVAELASRGYVVLALDHPYESDVAELPDGRVAAGVWRRPGPHEDTAIFMERLLRVRAADVRFLLDRLAAGAFGPGLDAGRVAVIGHSFGGATAALAAGEDPRIRAAANLDGAVWAPIDAKAFQGPFMLLQSDRRETGHGELYETSNGEILAWAANGAWRYEIPQANHFSFTDAPLLFSPPGRWILERVMGGSRGAAETQRATVDVLDAFLRGPLTGRPADVHAAARGHGLKGGPAR